RLGGQAGYAGGFVDRYILGFIYPEGLTRTTQIALGLAVFAVNGTIYLFFFSRRRRRWEK
ncbi:MAG TPA: DUF2784 family protein, partial [Steroidobacter sp.]|nr:DUF2784 family protein [Steroidobacter sp.]